jgi:decaprenylphospho-beta-D-erythro-pentofuranosid-2-ulose 2-reductase
MRDSLGRFQTVAVLGAGSDIASAALRELLRDGPFTALLCARDSGGLETSYLEAAGATVERHDFDALAFDRQSELLDTLFAREVDVDLVLVAFGLLADQHEAERDAALARALLETNFTAVVSLLTPLIERLVAQGHGTIVVLSSIAGVRARRSNYVYGSAKAGLDAFCQGAQLRLRGSGVELMIVRPGFVRTKMTAGLKPLPLALSAEDAGVAIVNGLRSGATIVWLPRAMRAVALVLRLLPRRILGSL